MLHCLRPGAYCVSFFMCCSLECGTSWCVCAWVCVSVSVSDYVMVPAFVDAANERVCLRHCALFHSGYRDAPVTECHGNRKWAGHLAHQWWGIPLASQHSGWLFDVPIGCLVLPLSSSLVHSITLQTCSDSEIVVISSYISFNLFISRESVWFNSMLITDGKDISLNPTRILHYREIGINGLENYFLYSSITVKHQK